MKLLFLMMKITLTQIAIPKCSCGAAKGACELKAFLQPAEVDSVRTSEA
jgi:hypothetical protein